MTVCELIKLLQAEDPELFVVLSKDAEGNGYSPLFGVTSNSVYEAESTWSGEVGLQTLTPELIEQGFTEEDVKTTGVPCLVLDPVN